MVKVIQEIKLSNSTNLYRKNMIQSIVKNVSKYLEIYDETKANSTKLQEITVGSYTNKSTSEVKTTLRNNGMKVSSIGNGEKIVDQYPKAGTKINKIDRVILLTNATEIKMPNLIGFSMKEAKILLDFMGIEYETIGNGYVTKQSIKEGEVVTKESKQILRFTTAPKEEEPPPDEEEKTE